MIGNLLLLFLAAFTGGIAALKSASDSGKDIKQFLVFAGAFLFSITVIHILPELFISSTDNLKIGILVLAGFFLQQILEFFSSGAEHGHVHIHDKKHHHNYMSAILVLSSLSIHAFLEGALLAHPSDIHLRHDAKALLTGIALHKIPAAFALVSILICYLPSRKPAIVYLVIFSLASPVGLLISDYLFENSYLDGEIFVMLFAIVSGSFLHISTTIVFESSPKHGFNAQRLVLSLLGAGAAIVAEQML